MSRSHTFSPAEVARYYAARAPQLPQRGKRWRGYCLLHRGKHSNFSVNPETGCWYCFSGCGRGGSLIDFELELTGADFRAALGAIYAIVGRPAPTKAWHATDSRNLLEQRRIAEIEQRDASHFACAAQVAIDAELERLPLDSPERLVWTQILFAIREDAGAVLRRLKQVDRRTAAALVYAGRRRQKRLQTSLARFIVRTASQEVDRAA